MNYGMMFVVLFTCYNIKITRERYIDILFVFHLCCIKLKLCVLTLVIVLKLVPVGTLLC